jgi:hypothetical protein
MSYINDFRVGTKPVKKVYLNNNIVWRRILSNSIVNIPVNMKKDTIATRLTERKIYDKI